MTSSAAANPDENKPEADKKPEPRKRKSEPKRLEAAPKTEAGETSARDIEPGADADAIDDRDGRRDGKVEKDSEAGKALAPAGAGPIDPFLIAKAEDKAEPPPPPRSFASRLLEYSAHAAIVVGLIGFAWTVSGHVIGQKKGDTSVSTAKSSAPGKPDEMGELRLANVKLHEEIRSLKASVDALRTAAKRDTTQEQVRVLSAGLENVKSSLGASKSETGAAIAQLQDKLDKVTPSKMQALAERVGRLEHQSVDTPSTGSIARSEPSRSEIVRDEPVRSDPAKAKAAASKPATNDAAKVAPTPPAKPAELAKLGDDRGASDDGKPPVIQGWLVRDVYQGVALVEGKRGTLEVVPGVSIPGAGVVKSIERKGGGWVVTTSKGTLAYAGAAAQREQRDQREYRRGGYGGGAYERGYAPYRYDY